MGISQPKVAGMKPGDFTNLAERKLMDCLNCFDCAIVIQARPAAEPIGRVALVAA